MQVWAEGAASPAKSPRPSRVRAAVMSESQSSGVRSNNPHLVTWQKIAGCISQRRSIALLAGGSRLLHVRALCEVGMLPQKMHSASFRGHFQEKHAKVRVQAAALVAQIHEALQDRAPTALVGCAADRCRIVYVAGSPHCTVRHEAEFKFVFFVQRAGSQAVRRELCCRYVPSALLPVQAARAIAC